MATKRILEKTSHEEIVAIDHEKDSKDAELEHNDKKPKLDDTKEGKEATTEETKINDSNETKVQAQESASNILIQAADEIAKQQDSSASNDPPQVTTGNESLTEQQRVNETIATARHEWLGQVERRHVRVGDDYQVTSLPVPGHEETPTNGNGKKK